MRLRKQKRERVVVPFDRSDDRGGHKGETVDAKSESPSAAALRGEIRRMLEHRIDELPVAFRTVFTLREVEEMTVEETADALGIPSATVRTRLFRARALLREALARDLDMATGDLSACRRPLRSDRRPRAGDPRPGTFRGAHASDVMCG